jgi:hypothetical protein
VINNTLMISMPTGLEGVLGILSAYVIHMVASVSETPLLLINGSYISPNDTTGDGYNDTATFNFSTLVNYEGYYTLTVQVQVLVLDVSANAYSNMLLIGISFIYRNITNQNYIQSTLQIQVVEPILSISKVALPVSKAEGEATVDYTISVHHASTFILAVYILSIVDPLSNMKSLVSSSVAATVPFGSVSIFSTGIAVNVSLFTSCVCPLLSLFY